MRQKGGDGGEGEWRQVRQKRSTEREAQSQSVRQKKGAEVGGDVLALVAIPVEISARSRSVIRLRYWERRLRTYVCVMDIPYSRTLRKVPISIGPCL